MNYKICIVGLGYVGLPLGIELAKHFEVIGFDINDKKINQMIQGIDPTHEVGNEVIQKTKLKFTSNPKSIKEANFIIIAVPTPIDDNNVPDLKYVLGASKLVGENLSKGAIIVYESTVYPGCTEEDCLPELEKASGLKLGDFGLGYSPERINPGDKLHRVDTIVKVISANNEDNLKHVKNVYGTIIKAGVHEAPTIKVAEAAKVIENVQRDLNIALMNELSIIFDKLNINTHDVIDAAGTKWNFHKYTPGLVGGHCIGVDPYYLTYKAQQLGYHPKVILAGREINDNMHMQVAKLAERSIGDLKNKKILILGLTFKENVPDYRNSRAKQLIETLKGKGAIAYGYDPLVDAEIIQQEFGAEPTKTIQGYDCTIIASPHEAFNKIYKEITTPIVDIKGTLKNKKPDRYYSL